LYKPTRFRTIDIPVRIPIIKSRREISVMRNRSANIAAAKHMPPIGINHSSRISAMAISRLHLIGSIKALAIEAINFHNVLDNAL
jgi:hypothetical protein